MGIFAGWGRLRYFDLEERKIGYRTTLADIPKMGNQWKIIHDFKPTAYLSNDNCNGNTEPGTIFVTQAGSIDQESRDFCMAFPVGEGCVRLFAEYMPEGNSMQLPQIGEWTRIELTQEFDEDAEKYFISLSFDGVEVIKVWDEEYLVDAITNGEQLRDVEIALGEQDVQIPGFIRRFVVLEKS